MLRHNKEQSRMEFVVNDRPIMWVSKKLWDADEERARQWFVENLPWDITLGFELGVYK